MNLQFVFAEAQTTGQVEQIARTFGVDWPHLVAQIISFSIVCIVLYLFAYKPILKMLGHRRELIAQGLANSEKISLELAKTEAQRQEVLALANIRASELIEEARAAAAQLREQEKQKAIGAAEQIMIKAREAAASDRSQMFTQLKREIGQLVVKTTAAITGKVLTTEDQRRLAEETSRELAAR